MDHQDFVSSLSIETRKNLIQRLDGLGLVYLAVHWGLIALFGLAIYLGLLGWQLLVIPQGIVIAFPAAHMVQILSLCTSPLHPGSRKRS